MIGHIVLECTPNRVFYLLTSIDITRYRGSRFYESSSASQSVELLNRVREDWEPPVPILEVITDHGSEFINTRQDERPCLDHEFEAYLHDHEIEHTLCEVGRPHSDCCDSLPPGICQTPVSGRETAAIATWCRK